MTSRKTAHIGTLFSKIMIVARDPETGSYVDINFARAILACGQDPDFILGWYVTAFEENGTAYRYCLYTLFSDKRRRLLQLGMNPESYPGILPGFAHEAIFDRGPARGKKVALLLPRAIALATALTFPYTPQHKGGIEGTNGRIQKELYRALDINEEVKEAVEEECSGLSSGFYSIEKLNKGRQKRREKKDGAGYIRMELRTFEILLVECINKLNLKREKSILSHSRSDILTQVEGTRAELYKKKFDKQIEMDGPKRKGARDMQLMMLEVKPVAVKSLKATYKRRTFGAFAGDRSSEAIELVEYMKDWPKRKILGQLTPEEISKKGHPQILVTLPPYR